MPMNSDSSVLLVVDVQNDFCPGGALAVPAGDEVIEPIQRLCPRFRRIVLTQDWHPKGHISFASSWPGHALYEEVAYGEGSQVLWPEHCVQASSGAAFHPDLPQEKASLIIRKGFQKGLDSYSAIFENDRKTATGLEGYLRILGVERLYITGLATDYCVKFTALDALALGFRVTIVSDAVRGVDAPTGSVESALRELRAQGADFATSEEILEALA